MLNGVEASTVGASVSDPPASERPAPTQPAPPSPEVRRKRGRPRDPEADGRILAAASVTDPAARLREHDRRRGGQQRRRRQGHGLPPLVAQGGPRGRGDGAALPRRDARRPTPARSAATCAAMYASVLDLRELPGRHRLRAHHHQGVDARRPHRHALPRGQRPRRADAPARSSSAPSRAARCARHPDRRPPSQFLGSLVATARRSPVRTMPGLDELDELVDFVLHGISA